MSAGQVLDGVASERPATANTPVPIHMMGEASAWLERIPPPAVTLPAGAGSPERHPEGAAFGPEAVLRWLGRRTAVRACVSGCFAPGEMDPVAGSGAAE
ncbi:hypothetical protein LDHU3_35.1210:CDS1 [Leishmania donovani]|uniref:Hypothetical_protein n=1 Tax=Leishmania donovani TaxID=5661 RepID=A0A6J8FN66_LEIDO|nr:hypothetical protein LDHU3_35.1210:CDS1 [Leishmania donovani]VDZ48736.1 hypothetical_protein [Leishmania donovani]